MKKHSVALLIVGLFLSACSIRQDITPSTEQIETDEICIVDNPNVRNGFLEAMQKTLIERGYKPKVFSKNDRSLDDCKYNIIYTANWKWDLALYMAYAKIDVIHNNRVVAAALYDSNHGGANPKKWVKGDNKVNELISQMLPLKNGAQPPVQEKVAENARAE